jgi:integrase
VKGYIRRRSAGSWQVFVELGVDPVSGRRLRQSQNVRGNRRDAERIQAQLINAVDTGTYIDPRQGTVAEYLARWLRDYASQSVAPRTFEGYRRIVRTRIVPSLGSIRLAPPISSPPSGHGSRAVACTAGRRWRRGRCPGSPNPA